MPPTLSPEMWVVKGSLSDETVLLDVYNILERKYLRTDVEMSTTALEDSARYAGRYAIVEDMPSAIKDMHKVADALTATALPHGSSLAKAASARTFLNEFFPHVIGEPLDIALLKKMTSRAERIGGALGMSSVWDDNMTRLFFGDSPALLEKLHRPDVTDISYEVKQILRNSKDSGLVGVLNDASKLGVNVNLDAFAEAVATPNKTLRYNKLVAAVGETAGSIGKRMSILQGNRISSFTLLDALRREQKRLNLAVTSDIGAADKARLQQRLSDVQFYIGRTKGDMKALTPDAERELNKLIQAKKILNNKQNLLYDQRLAEHALGSRLEGRVDRMARGGTTAEQGAAIGEILRERVPITDLSEWAQRARAAGIPVPEGVRTPRPGEYIDLVTRRHAGMSQMEAERAGSRMHGRPSSKPPMFAPGRSGGKYIPIDPEYVPVSELAAQRLQVVQRPGLGLIAYETRPAMISAARGPQAALNQLSHSYARQRLALKGDLKPYEDVFFYKPKYRAGTPENLVAIAHARRKVIHKGQTAFADFTYHVVRKTADGDLQAYLKDSTTGRRAGPAYEKWLVSSFRALDEAKLVEQHDIFQSPPSSVPIAGTSYSAATPSRGVTATGQTPAFAGKRPMPDFTGHDVAAGKAMFEAEQTGRAAAVGTATDRIRRMPVVAGPDIRHVYFGQGKAQSVMAEVLGNMDELVDPRIGLYARSGVLPLETATDMSTAIRMLDEMYAKRDLYMSDQVGRKTVARLREGILSAIHESVVGGDSSLLSQDSVRQFMELSERHGRLFGKDLAGALGIAYNEESKVLEFHTRGHTPVTMQLGAMGDDVEALAAGRQSFSAMELVGGEVRVVSAPDTMLNPPIGPGSRYFAGAQKPVRSGFYVHDDAIRFMDTSGDLNELSMKVAMQRVHTVPAPPDALMPGSMLAIWEAAPSDTMPGMVRPITGYQKLNQNVIKRIYGMGSAEEVADNMMVLANLAGMKQDRAALVDEIAKDWAQRRYIERDLAHWAETGDVMERAGHVQTMRILSNYKQKVAKELTIDDAMDIAGRELGQEGVVTGYSNRMVHDTLQEFQRRYPKSTLEGVPIPETGAVIDNNLFNPRLMEARGRAGHILSMEELLAKREEAFRRLPGFAVGEEINAHIQQIAGSGVYDPAMKGLLPDIRTLNRVLEHEAQLESDLKLGSSLGESLISKKTAELTAIRTQREAMSFGLEPIMGVSVGEASYAIPLRTNRATMRALYGIGEAGHLEGLLDTMVENLPGDTQRQFEANLILNGQGRLVHGMTPELRDESLNVIQQLARGSKLEDIESPVVGDIAETMKRSLKNLREEGRIGGQGVRQAIANIITNHAELGNIKPTTWAYITQEAELAATPAATTSQAALYIQKYAQAANSGKAQIARPQRARPTGEYIFDEWRLRNEFNIFNKATNSMYYGVTGDREKAVEWYLRKQMFGDKDVEAVKNIMNKTEAAAAGEMGDTKSLLGRLFVPAPVTHEGKQLLGTRLSELTGAELQQMSKVLPGQETFSIFNRLLGHYMDAAGVERGAAAQNLSHANPLGPIPMTANPIIDAAAGEVKVGMQGMRAAGEAVEEAASMAKNAKSIWPAVAITAAVGYGIGKFLSDPLAESRDSTDSFKDEFPRPPRAPSNMKFLHTTPELAHKNVSINIFGRKAPSNVDMSSILRDIQDRVSNVTPLTVQYEQNVMTDNSPEALSHHRQQRIAEATLGPDGQFGQTRRLY